MLRIQAFQERFRIGARAWSVGLGTRLIDLSGRLRDVVKEGHDGVSPSLRRPTVIDSAAPPGTRRNVDPVIDDSEIERVLVVMAHPDDVDFGLGGTVATWTEAGIEVSYCMVTSGDAGGFDPDVPRSEIAGIRQAEQRAAAAVLGVSDVRFLGYPDGRVEVTLDLRCDIARVIREVRPQPADLSVAGTAHGADAVGASGIHRDRRGDLVRHVSRTPVTRSHSLTSSGTSRHGRLPRPG